MESKGTLGSSDTPKAFKTRLERPGAATQQQQSSLSIYTRRLSPEEGLLLVGEYVRCAGVPVEMTSTQVKFLGDISGVLSRYDEAFIGRLMLHSGIEHRQAGMKTLFNLSQWAAKNPTQNLDCMLVSESGERLPLPEVHRPSGINFTNVGSDKMPLIGTIPGLEEWLKHAVHKAGSLFRHGKQYLATANDLATAISLGGYMNNIHVDDVDFVCAQRLEMETDFKVTEKQSSIAYRIEPFVVKKPLA